MMIIFFLIPFIIQQERVYQTALIGKWYLQSSTTTGMVKAHHEYKMNDTPEILEFDSNGCFMMIYKNSNYTHAGWKFDELNNRVTVDYKHGSCANQNEKTFFTATYRIEGNFLTNETTGRDTKHVSRYAKRE